MLSRRDFLLKFGLSTGSLILFPYQFSFSENYFATEPFPEISSILPAEDIFAYIHRVKGSFDLKLYRQIIGSANPYKEGDAAQNIAATDEKSRENARELLRNTLIKDICEHPLFEDELFQLIQNTTDQIQYRKIENWTMGVLKSFILNKAEQEIKSIMPGLSSDIIGCLVKLMNNQELIQTGQKIFNPLPGSNIGAKGYLGARIQPNSPTDHPDDIMMQVFDGFSYAVGDVVLGTNPVSGAIDSVAGIEEILFDIIRAFGLENTLPHSVLSHIDVQAAAEKRKPGTTGIWFQSLGGTVNANRTFDLTLEKMLNYASERKGKYGLYIETGQGADGTNGNGEGFDMVVHESRKYGFVRALRSRIAEVQPDSFPGPWVHVNDVAGFIGPEVFKTKEQLVRCCLEDTVMGKLHGLTIGLDICTTLHMDISLDDLVWCIDEIMPANPAYLMALPTKNDPMLSYLTTGFNDHVRIRSKFGYKVNDAMWDFFKKIQIIDATGNITQHFGDPLWVFYQYRLAKNDTRSQQEIYSEGKRIIAEVEDRGVLISKSYGKNIWDLEPELEKKIVALYEDSKTCLWKDMPQGVLPFVPNQLNIKSTSEGRKDYIYHPPTGEIIHPDSLAKLKNFRKKWKDGVPDVQIIISDGLNVSAITDQGHLMPYIEKLRIELKKAGYRVSDDNIVIHYGRVRAGYRCGEYLFGQAAAEDKAKAIVHVIGERPGTQHHNFSAYLSAPLIRTWNQKGTLDHNHSKVVSGISDTALNPEIAAVETVRILKEMFQAAG